MSVLTPGERFNLPPDVVEHFDQAEVRKCANRRRHWDCFKCGMPTPVGASFCRNHNECTYRIMEQRDRALARRRNGEI